MTPPENYYKVKRCHDETYDIIRETAEIYDFSDKPEVERSLLTLCDIVTAWCNEKLYSNVDTYCSFFNADILPEYVYEAEKLAALGRKRWWYGCDAPKNPFPNHHTDSPLVDSRIEPWMRFYRGIEGDLYWSVNVNYPYNEKTGKYEKDILKDPHWCAEDNGEGLLVYTGTKYGEPFPTLRLNAICEGQKDYEYLVLLESLCKQKQNEYETRFNVGEMLSDLFLSMFDETCNLSSASRVDEGKEELAGRIELAEKGVFIFGKGETAEIYAPNDADISVENGRMIATEKAGKGKKLTFALENAREFVVVCGGKKIIIFSFASVGLDISSLAVADEEVFPPYAVNYWRNTNARYLTGHRKMKAGKVSVSDYRGGKLIESEPFINTAPPVLSLGCNVDFSCVTHVAVKLESLCSDAFILQTNLFDKNGNRYEIGYGVIEPNQTELRIAVNELMEKRLNTLYDYVAVWKEEIAERHKKILESFDFSAVRKNTVRSSQSCHAARR